MILVEEVPSNWQQRWSFWKVSSRIVCAAMADLSVSFAELSQRTRESLDAETCLSVLFCVQKRLTSSFKRGDSLACICEETFLRKG